MASRVELWNHQGLERRRPNRPINGDRRPCPSCGGHMRFREGCVVTRVRVTVTQPAWVCSCGEDTYVRTIVNVRGPRAPVERRFVTRVDLRKGVLDMRHALAYLCEQMQVRSALAMRDQVRHAIAELQQCQRIGILAADDSGRFIAVNNAVCNLTGYSRDELLDMGIWDLSLKRNIEKGQRMWRHFLRAGGFDGEYDLRRKTGELIEVRCIAAAHVTPGLHVATILSFTNI
jgi:PAS domain S-box-containing protein